MKIVKYLINTPFRIVKSDIAEYRQLRAQEREWANECCVRYENITSNIGLFADSQDIDSKLNADKACHTVYQHLNFAPVTDDELVSERIIYCHENCAQFATSPASCNNCRHATRNMAYHAACALYQQARSRRREFWANRMAARERR